MNAKKIFRIEQFGSSQKADQTQSSLPIIDFKSSSEAAHSDVNQDQILAAIKELKAMIVPPEAVSKSMVDDLKKELAEVKKLEDEMSKIQESIRNTKHEIASLHCNDLKGHEVTRMTDELDAVVGGTEHATETILASAEQIDEKAGSLCAKLEGDDAGMANDISEAVVNIFEACNFQDITGQRINKVVTAMRFIEERIERMMDIWGGLDGLADVMPDVEQLSEEEALLNGPALEEDENVASQDDIDALFG